MSPQTSNSSGSNLQIPWADLPWLAIALLSGLFVALYWDVSVSMYEIWMKDDAYSHGILVPPLAGYLVWIDRERIFGIRAERDSRGLFLVAGACLMYLLGRLGAEFFLMRQSMVVLLAGVALTFWGWERLKALVFPFFLLATMVPLPQIIYNKLAAPLQLFASWVASGTLELLGIPVFRDGNVMNLAEISLGVAEACSGLRSILSLTVLALVVGFFVCRTPLMRVALLLLALPTAIVVNVARIVLTALLARSNPELAEGFFHTFSGWVVFLVGFGILYLLAVGLSRLEPSGEAAPAV